MNEKNVCPICYDNFVNYKTQCNHEFCYSCWNIWESQSKILSCPLCRTKLPISYKKIIKNYYNNFIDFYFFLDKYLRDMDEAFIGE